MPREFARVKLSIWEDDDFRALSPEAQHLYFVLLTSSKLDYAGVTDFRPGRIAKGAESWRPWDVLKAAEELSAALYIVIDVDTEEVLLRSFIRHDGLLQEPNMAVAMRKAWTAVASPTLRGVVVHELQRLHAEGPDLKGWARVSDLLGKASVNPSEIPSFTPSDDPWGNPSVPPSAGGAPKATGEPSRKASLTTSPSTSPISISLTAAAAPKAARPRDGLWDAIVDACHIDPDSLTSSARGPIATAKKQLTEVGATPAEVATRARRFREEYPRMTLTPTALVKHWPALLPKVKSGRPEGYDAAWEAGMG